MLSVAPRISAENVSIKRCKRSMLSISERVNRRLPTVLKGKLHSLAPSDDSGSPSLALDYRHLRADREAAMAEKVRLKSTRPPEFVSVS
jgi:hypothetical protein